MQTNRDPQILTNDLRERMITAICDEADDAGWDADYVNVVVVAALTDWPADTPVPMIDYSDLDESMIADWSPEAIINMTVDYFIGHWPGHPGM